MTGTFSQLYVQVVFAVKGRENLIKKEFRTELHEYIAGIIKGKDQKPIIVNGVGDLYMFSLDSDRQCPFLIWSEISRIILRILLIPKSL